MIHSGGNDGDDGFIYNSGDGKNIISGFEDDDMLQITGSFLVKY